MIQKVAFFLCSVEKREYKLLNLYRHDVRQPGRSGGSFALPRRRPGTWRRRSVRDSPCRLSAWSETCFSKLWAGPTVSARPVAWARCLGEPALPGRRVCWWLSCHHAGFGLARRESAGVRWCRAGLKSLPRTSSTAAIVASSAGVGTSVPFIQGQLLLHA